MFLPQHFLNLRPLPQIQGSLRPIFGVSRIIGALEGVQQGCITATGTGLH